MFGLFATLLSTLGATGMGSILKIVAGIIDSRAAANEAREKREMLREAQSRELDIQWAATVFGADTESQHYGRATRRIIAIIGVCIFGAIAIPCAFFPYAEIITFKLPEHTQPLRLLWGLITFPSGSDPTVRITSGHLAIMALTQLGLIFGFYFTPGGRK